MRRRVTIQTATRVHDGYGGETVTWATLATVWAAVEPLRGRENVTAGQVEAVGDTLMVIRYLSTVTPLCQVVKGSTTYQVLSVVADGKQTEMQLVCAAVTR